MNKLVLIAITMFLLLMGAVVMPEMPFPGELPFYVEITGLDGFTLTGSTPGTYSGSDSFTVGVNNDTGATVSSSITSFSPSLTNTASTNVVPANVPQGITGCTVTANIDITMLDVSGAHSATLTITVTNNP